MDLQGHRPSPAERQGPKLRCVLPDTAFALHTWLASRIVPDTYRTSPLILRHILPSIALRQPCIALTAELCPSISNQLRTWASCIHSWPSLVQGQPTAGTTAVCSMYAAQRCTHTETSAHQKAWSASNWLLSSDIYPSPFARRIAPVISHSSISSVEHFVSPAARLHLCFIKASLVAILTAHHVFRVQGSCH